MVSFRICGSRCGLSVRSVFSRRIMVLFSSLFKSKTREYGHFAPRVLNEIEKAVKIRLYVRGFLRGARKCVLHEAVFGGNSIACKNGCESTCLLVDNCRSFCVSQISRVDGKCIDLCKSCNSRGYHVYEDPLSLVGCN